MSQSITINKKNTFFKVFIKLVAKLSQSPVQVHSISLQVKYWLHFFSIYHANANLLSPIRVIQAPLKLITAVFFKEYIGVIARSLSFLHAS